MLHPVTSSARTGDARFAGTLALWAVLALSTVAAGTGCNVRSEDPPASGTGGASATGTGGAAGQATGGSSGSGGTTTTPGSGGSLGSGGATSVDAGADAAAGADTGPSTPTGSCPAGATCFDFEKDVAGGKPGAPWMVGKGTITVENTGHIFSGSQAVRVQATSNTEGAFITLTDGFPRPGNEYYARAMMWADVIPPSAHWTFVQSGFGKVDGQTYTAIYNFGAIGSKIIANYDTIGFGSDCSKGGSTVLTKQWVCVEWHFKGQPEDQLDLWINGVADKASVLGQGTGCVKGAATQPWLAPTFPNMQVGYEGFSGTTNIDIWYDDIAISSARVGCPAK